MRDQFTCNVRRKCLGFYYGFGLLPRGGGGNVKQVVLIDRGEKSRFRIVRLVNMTDCLSGFIASIRRLQCVCFWWLLLTERMYAIWRSHGARKWRSQDAQNWRSHDVRQLSNRNCSPNDILQLLSFSSTAAPELASRIWGRERFCAPSDLKTGRSWRSIRRSTFACWLDAQRFIAPWHGDRYRTEMPNSTTCHRIPARDRTAEKRGVGVKQAANCLWAALPALPQDKPWKIFGSGKKNSFTDLYCSGAIL